MLLSGLEHCASSGAERLPISPSLVSKEHVIDQAMIEDLCNFAKVGFNKNLLFYFAVVFSCLGDVFFQKISTEFITIDSQIILTSMTFEIPLLTFFRCPSFEGHALGSFPGPWEWKNANRSDGGRFQEKVLRFPWILWEKHLSNIIWMSFDSSNPLFRQIFVRVFEGFICKCSFFNRCI